MSTSSLGPTDAALLTRLVSAERTWLADDEVSGPAKARASEAAALRALAAEATDSRIIRRARNLAALLDPALEQPFGPLEGMTTRDPAFVVPLSCAARYEMAVPPHAVELWVKELRPGIPTEAWQHASAELVQLVVMRCPPIIPRVESQRLAVSYEPLGGRPRRIRRIGPRASARPPAELRELIAQAEQDLRPLVRTAGRDPVLRLARIPEELFAQLADTAGAQRAETAVNRLLTQLPRNAGELFERVIGPRRELDSLELVLLSELAERFGVGFEPDIRHLGPPPTIDTPVRAFNVDGESTRSAAFAAASLLVQVSAAMAHADGRLVSDEAEQLDREIHDAPGLTDAQRRRLRYRAEIFLLEPPDPELTIDRLRSLRGDQRDLVCRLLVRVAASDGHIHEREYETLVQAFRTMRLTKKHVESLLEETAPEATVAAAAPRTRGRRDRRSGVGKEQDDQQYEVLKDLLLGSAGAALES